MRRLSLHISLLVLTVPLVLLAAPAHAELRVRLSRSLTGRYESVGITVTDPLGGQDARPGPIEVTMADARDRRQTVHLDSAGRPGEWRGRFTPLGTGRYTGTAVLERGEGADIGLVPLIRVRDSGKPGFLRRPAAGSRVFSYSRGGGLFPIGVRLDADDLRAELDWRGRFADLRASGVNYLEVPVSLDGLSGEDGERVLQSVDALLLLAERAGRFGIQVRLEPPRILAEEGADAYEADLQRCVRRWAYSPAVAVWYVSGAGSGVPDDLASRFIQAVKSSDPYKHLVATPAPAPGQDSRSNLVVADAFEPAAPGASTLFQMPVGLDVSGETAWQMLARGGIGLPLCSYDPEGAEAATVLSRLRSLAQAARAIPLHAPAAPVTAALPNAPAPQVRRYGRVLAGWVAPEDDRLLVLSRIARGRYRVRFWDAESDAGAGEQLIWSSGHSVGITLPPAPRSIFLRVEPAPRGRAAASRLVSNVARIRRPPGRSTG